MQVSSINANPAVFKSNEQAKTGGGGKAVASAFIPGLGQFCDGRHKAGAGFLLGSIGLGIIGNIASVPIIKEIMKHSENLFENMDNIGKIALPNIPKAKLIAPLLVGLASTGLWIANIVDAYKGGKNN